MTKPDPVEVLLFATMSITRIWYMASWVSSKVLRASGAAKAIDAWV
jgi:hypothetical protein